MSQASNPPPGIVLRGLTPGDQAFIWEALHVALWDPPPQPLRPREILQSPNVAQYAAGWGKPGDIGVLSLKEESQKPTGAAWVRLWNEPPQGLSWIDDETPQLGIAVLDAWRGRGVGAALMSRLIDETKKHFRAISLSVHPENPAIALYKKFDFVEVDVGRGYKIMLLQLR